MSGAREEILARVRVQVALRGGAIEPPSPDERRAVVPARATLSGVDLLDLFVRRATGAAMTVSRVSRIEDLPAAAARFVDSELGPAGGGATAVSVPPRWSGLAWKAAGLDCTAHPPSPLHPVSITAGWAGIAETGTCVIRTGSENAHSAAVLTRANVIALDASAVVATIEDVFARARAEALPRSLLFVTGPSRTGDIGATVVVPAQGPARVHIVLVGG